MMDRIPPKIIELNKEMTKSIDFQDNFQIDGRDSFFENFHRAGRETVFENFNRAGRETVRLDTFR